MAKQKVLITNKMDFISLDTQNAKFVPFLASNAEDHPAQIVDVGTPTFVDGVRGKGIKHNRNYAYKWHSVTFPDDTKRIISFWFKPTAEDVEATGSNWRILASTRGDGYGTNYGFHAALYNGRLNVRVYGNAGSLDMYSQGTTGTSTYPYFMAEADKWHHFLLIYDEDGFYKVDVFVDGVRILYSGVNPHVRGFTRSFTIGDMLNSNGTISVNAFEGETDEVFFISGEAWTMDNRGNYYDDITNNRFVDYWTLPGSIQLPQYIKRTEIERDVPDGEPGETEIIIVEELVYSDQVVEWESKALDLDKPFDNYGRLQINYEAPQETTLRFFTKVSSDGTQWSVWEELRHDGVIISPSERFLKIKIQLSTGNLNKTPRVDEIQVLEYGTIERLPLVNQPLKLYKDLDTGLEYIGELMNAYDIIVEEEINGEDLLTFKVPINDPKRRELGAEPVELIAEISDRRYIIREAIDERSDDGKLYTTFKAEALFYELRDFKIPKLELEDATAFQAITEILKASVPASGWTLGLCEIPNTRKRDIKIEWKSVLMALREVLNIWGGELVFNSITKEVSFYQIYGADNGVRFYYNKNLKRIVRTVDTYELITRLYPQGKGNLDIKTVNEGIEYLEDLTWVNALELRNKIRVGHWKDEGYIYPSDLKEAAQLILEDISRPRIGYVVTVQDLSLLSGHEHESFNMGDYVYTVDNELLSSEIKSRIIRRQYNVREPWKTVVELAQSKRLLSDALRKAVDDKMEYLQTADLLDATDARQMTVFNYLLNSRAEQGINADWQQIGTGFTIANEGHSGEWSFKVDGNFGKTNRLIQRVYGVSHRNSYTISAAVGTEGQVVRGGTQGLEPFVGLKVVITYTDGTKEEQLLGIDDTTKN
ncbi:phage tail spike protein [Alkaliphilus peptidifermentans]|uniref:Phage minor structural protein, N-terminal region n=1 Tax=Alkaliphilus peptidifermentans DSM 18978 TaxID=1120976 RepID=A0A1G5JKZ6_9FIRM|nr:phage tail spike protein [Alkaliphilus peptidifermentans]SCY88591.1 phage minor structural protein, N-terminal region [Alkaliphilus peptidifermentans DSM 18978]